MDPSIDPGMDPSMEAKPGHTLALGVDETALELVRLLDRLQEDVRQLQADKDRLQSERAELFGRLGFYQARIQHLEEQVALLQAPPPGPTELTPSTAEELIAEPEPDAPIAPEPKRRSWWKVLLFG
jgi:hypothetical protein